MTALAPLCTFEGCMVGEDHRNGFTDYHVRDVEHGPVTISYSVEADSIRTAAWIPGISEFTFESDTIAADLEELDALIAGLTSARTAIADWVQVTRLRRPSEVDEQLREVEN